MQNGLFKILKTDVNGNAVIDISKLDYLGFCRIVWSMEKAADPDAAPFDERLDSLDSLPIIDAIEQIIELLLAYLLSKSKIKTPTRRQTDYARPDCRRSTHGADA